MDSTTERAGDAKRLLADATFQNVVAELKEAAGKVFFNPCSTPEQIAAAHERIRGLHLIETELKSRLDRAKPQRQK